MVRTKTQASKKPRRMTVDSSSSSGQSDPSPIPPPSSPVAPAVLSQPETKAVATNPSASSSSELQPLPKEREANQPAITKFFSKSPKAAVNEAPPSTAFVTQPKQRATRKGKSVEKPPPPPVLAPSPTPKIPEQALAISMVKPSAGQKKAKSTKEEKNKGPATEQVEQSAPRPEKLMASSFKAAEVVQKKQEEGQAKKKKKKSELDDLEAPLPIPTKTRQKKMMEEPLPPVMPTPLSPPTLPKEARATEPSAPRPLRRKTWASKTKAKAARRTSEFYPFISAKAKAVYNDYLGAKHPVKERALNLEHTQTDRSIKEIIHALGWDTFCQKPDEGILQVVKEFYANLEDRVDDKVFVRGIWVPIISTGLNQLLGTPEYLEDEYSVMVENEVSKEEQEQQLCSTEREIIWTKGKNNQLLSFNKGALLPQWTPLFKFICSRLIPTTHTSNVTIDRATLLMAMIQKKQVDAGWIIHNNIIESAGPTKGLWFP